MEIRHHAPSARRRMGVYSPRKQPGRAFVPVSGARRPRLHAVRGRRLMGAGVMPSFLAVVILMTNSNLAGCVTGKSEGFFRARHRVVAQVRRKPRRALA